MRRRPIVRSRRPALQSIRRAVAEELETRRLLASFVVNTTLDESVPNATLSLREAIAAAEANDEIDSISFDEFVFDPSSSHTISGGNNSPRRRDSSSKIVYAARIWASIAVQRDLATRFRRRCPAFIVVSRRARF